MRRRSCEYSVHRFVDIDLLTLARILHLFHLEKLVEGDTFSLKVADAIHNTSVCPLDIPRLYIGDISLGGDFAVINDLLGLVVWDWKKNKTTQVVFVSLPFIPCNPCLC